MFIWPGVGRPLPVFYRWHAMIMMKPQLEDLPFSIVLLELYQEFQQAPSQEIRNEIAKQIAATFASERDNTDSDASEEYHEFFESYEKAALRYDQQASRLSRLALNLISGYLTQHETTVEELMPAVSPISN